jgi:hypothetical protein
VAGAQLNDRLKAATEAPMSASGGFGGGKFAGDELALRSLGLSSTVAVDAAAEPELRTRQRLVEYSQQTRFVNGRNFFQNGAQWIDTEVQKHQDAKRTRIQFGSPEYFNFVANNNQALPWLALGQNVQFVLKGAVFEIHE